MNGCSPAETFDLTINPFELQPVNVSHQKIKQTWEKLGFETSTMKMARLALILALVVCFAVSAKATVPDIQTAKSGEVLPSSGSTCERLLSSDEYQAGVAMGPIQEQLPIIMIDGESC